MLSWISDSLAESEPAPKDMTAVNAGVHELGVRLPLQSYSGGHAVFMYSTAADGNVTLQLRESDDLDRSGLAAMLARLQDDATFSISYQDSDILSDGSIDVLLGTGTGTLQGSVASASCIQRDSINYTSATEGVTATFDLFDSSSGPDLTLSPQTFTNSAEAFINDNSNSLGVPTENESVTTTTEDKKPPVGSSSEVVKLAVKRPRPKAASPNRQGPQQCQVCAKVFGNASALAKHKLTHSDERKYVCTMCGKAFKRQDHLNGHMLTHRNKKPYECKAEGCGKSYCDARSLRRHTENHHSSSTVSTNTTTMSPAQGAASGDAASPHGSSCIQYAPPPPSTSTGKSQLQQLLATEPAKSGNGGNNDGLTKQQLDLIHQIMEQTQRQSHTVTKPAAKPASKPTSKAPNKLQKSQGSLSNKTSTGGSTPTKITTTTSTSVPINSANKTESKPVECNLCHRKFKNIPALNGHMRLHGGYFKKDAENKKCEKKDPSGPPLQTASVSVRALIEEKIINKRSTNPPPPTNGEDTTRSGAPPLFPLTVHSSNNSSDLDSKITSFVVPAPPQQPTEKGRRHSDADAFTIPKQPNTQQEAEALADLILKKGKVAVKRTTSDPGQPTQQVIQLQTGESLTLTGVTYQSEDSSGYFSQSLQDEVFTQVQDTMLLQSVDAQHLTSIQFRTDSLLHEQSEDQLHDIASLEDYASVTASLQETVQSPSYQSNHSVNQDLQAVLDSPLPESLAEFSTFHSATNLDIPSPGYQTQSPAQYTESPHTSLTAQSPLQSPLIRHDSPGFAYPTPPASHEGRSPCFGQNTILPMVSPKQNDFTQVGGRELDEPPQASSPLSAAFFTSTMSSSAAVEEALEEVLPGESISTDDIYPLTNSPTPQSPLSVGLTPVASPLSNIPASSVSSPHPSTTYTPSPSNVTFPLSPHYSFQSQMMPNSDDPLLSSSPKDTKKKFEFNGLPLKVISSNGLIDTNFTGILVESNGELKLVQTNGNALQTKNIVVTGASLLHAQNFLNKDIQLKNGERIPKVTQTHTNLPIKFAGQRETFKQDGTDVFISPNIVPASPIRQSRKRPRSEPLQLPVLYQSRLRATRSRPHGSSTYTPPPLLNPTRSGSGLYCSLKKENREDAYNVWNNESIPESDSTPHINIGSQFQCHPPPCRKGLSRVDLEPNREFLLWNPSCTLSDNEVDMYLDFACCAAVPGGGRNKEYAMHLLHMCGGNIHEAMLKLMHPYPALPHDHPLLHYQYSDSDRWSSEEIEAFQHALFRYGKDFFSISRDIGSKSTKQCVQFYYIWKKVCADEYRRMKVSRESKRSYSKGFESDSEEKPHADVKLLGIADAESPIPFQEHKNFICEFPDCSASFNSKAALNGHIRIHGGTVRNSPTPSTVLERRTSTTPTMCHSDSSEDYPCKICGKVFTKIKSRSAHMKSHRPPDAEPLRRREKDTSCSSSFDVFVSSPFTT
uniref:Transcriptional-regulating factor 1 n=2 Tax=Photinus pyralis TaxID=7054 RepID=A0A1Y1LPB3_PHOPY